MIARLRGKLVAVELGAVIVDAGGVGYRVHVPDRSVAGLGEPGTEIQLFTHLHVRDSELSLYGAADAETLRLFQTLIMVNGVGPRLAMTVLGVLTAEAVLSSVETQDVTTLTRVPGVGKKTAQRIILDLKGQLPHEIESGPAPADDDALLALASLGYTLSEARDALARLEQQDSGAKDAPADVRLRGALKLLSRL